MALLLIGLVLFLGLHSVRIWGEPLRTKLIARLGEGPWKGLYSLISVAGFAAIVWGYGEARAQPSILYVLPAWTRYVTAALVLVALVLISAAYVPGNRIRAAVRHPMTLSVAFWALAHLIANGNVADVALFGGFLAWAAALYPTALRRDVRLGKAYVVAPGYAKDAIVIAAGVGSWAVLAFWLHVKMFGVIPLP